jgi:hypothetical protein
MTGEQQIAKNVEGSSRGLIWGTVSLSGTSQNHEKNFSHDNLSSALCLPGLNMNPGPLEYEARIGDCDVV